VASLAVASGGGWVWSVGSEIIGGYTAKMLCSCVFVVGRETERCIEEDLAEYEGLFTADVDRSQALVSSRALGLRTARARHRAEFGCTLE
jgi:hypothetical protein